MDRDTATGECVSSMDDDGPIEVKRIQSTQTILSLKLSIQRREKSKNWSTGKRQFFTVENCAKKVENEV